MLLTKTILSSILIIMIDLCPLASGHLFKINAKFKNQNLKYRHSLLAK